MKTKNIYMIGIKGVGMTMLAQFLSKEGHRVSGSDIADVFLTDKVLADNKIRVSSPFSLSNLEKDIDLVIYSTAFNEENNIELKELLRQKKAGASFEIMPYAKGLATVFNTYQGIAVCGSHGKTTVSAWLGYILWQANKAPNVLVGSSVPQFKGSSLKGRSKLFVAEVDEYQNKLQYFFPHGVILNNINFDHPDFFKSEADYLKVFVDFVKKIKSDGFLVLNLDDASSGKIIKALKGKLISYSVENEEAISAPTSNYYAYNIRTKGASQYFEVNNFGDFKIRLSGRHSISNALAVIASARELKVPMAKIKKYLSEFKGTTRREQVLGKYKGALIIDDYAHHPAEVKTTISGIKERYPKKKIRLVFHPHTFTRTKALFSDFVKSFTLADELIILDIYGSAREEQGGVSSLELKEAIAKYNKENGIKQKLKQLKTIKSVANYLAKDLDEDDLLLLMGAGDVFRVANILLQK